MFILVNSTAESTKLPTILKNDFAVTGGRIYCGVKLRNSGEYTEYVTEAVVSLFLFFDCHCKRLTLLILERGLFWTKLILSMLIISVEIFRLIRKTLLKTDTFQGIPGLENCF